MTENNRKNVNTANAGKMKYYPRCGGSWQAHEHPTAVSDFMARLFNQPSCRTKSDCFLSELIARGGDYL